MMSSARIIFALFIWCLEYYNYRLCSSVTLEPSLTYFDATALVEPERDSCHYLCSFFLGDKTVFPPQTNIGCVRTRDVGGSLVAHIL